MSQSITHDESRAKMMHSLNTLWNSLGFTSAFLGIVWNFGDIKGAITFILASIFFMVQGYFKIRKWLREDRREEMELQDEINRKRIKE